MIIIIIFKFIFISLEIHNIHLFIIPLCISNYFTNMLKPQEK